MTPRPNQPGLLAVLRAKAAEPHADVIGHVLAIASGAYAIGATEGDLRPAAAPRGATSPRPTEAPRG